MEIIRFVIEFNIKCWQEFGKRCDFCSNLRHSMKFSFSWWSHSFYQTKIPSVQVDGCVITFEHPSCIPIRFGLCVKCSSFCLGTWINYMLNFFIFSRICILPYSYQNSLSLFLLVLILRWLVCCLCMFYHLNKITACIESACHFSADCPVHVIWGWNCIFKPWCNVLCEWNA